MHSGKESVCQCRRFKRQVRSLRQEDPLEEGMATHSSIHTWRIPWTEEPGMPQSTGLQRVRHNWNHLAHTRSLFPSDLSEPLAVKEEPIPSCWTIIATQQALFSPLTYNISRSYSSWLSVKNNNNNSHFTVYSKSLTYMNILNAHKSYEVDRNTHCTDEEMEAQRSRAEISHLEDLCRTQKQGTFLAVR